MMHFEIQQRATISTTYDVVAVYMMIKYIILNQYRIYEILNRNLNVVIVR